MLGPAETFEQREWVSMAVLTLMERLSPVERAVYILREAFSYSHGGALAAPVREQLAHLVAEENGCGYTYITTNIAKLDVARAADARHGKVADPRPGPRSRRPAPSSAPTAGST